MDYHVCHSFAASSSIFASLAASTAVSIMSVVLHLALAASSPSRCLWFSPWRESKAQNSLSPASCRHFSLTGPSAAPAHKASVFFTNAALVITESFSSCRVGCAGSGGARVVDVDTVVDGAEPNSHQMSFEAGTAQRSGAGKHVPR